MDITDIVTTLTGARDVDAPTTKKQTVTIAAKLTDNALAPLGEWAEEFTQILQDAQALLEDLHIPEQSDPDERTAEGTGDGLAALSRWAEELADALREVTAALDELSGAETADRDAYYGTVLTEVETLLDTLTRIGVPVEASTGV